MDLCILAIWMSPYLVYEMPVRVISFILSHRFFKQSRPTSKVGLDFCICFQNGLQSMAHVFNVISALVGTL